MRKIQSRIAPQIFQKSNSCEVIVTMEFTRDKQDSSSVAVVRLEVESKTSGSFVCANGNLLRSVDLEIPAEDHYVSLLIANTLEIEDSVTVTAICEDAISEPLHFQLAPADRERVSLLKNAESEPVQRTNLVGDTSIVELTGFGCVGESVCIGLEPILKWPGSGNATVLSTGSWRALYVLPSSNSGLDSIYISRFKNDNFVVLEPVWYGTSLQSQ